MYMKRVKWIFYNIPELISCSAFAVILLVVFFNVLLRYILSMSFMWCEEVAAIGFVWIIFIGAAACYKRKMLISIDVVVTLLPAKVMDAITVCMNVFMILLNVWMVYLSLVFSLSAWTKLTLILGIPYTLIDIPAAIGFAFMTGYAIRDLITCLRRRKEKT